MASAGVRAYNGGLGAVPSGVQRQLEPVVKGSGAKLPEAERLLVYDIHTYTLLQITTA